jgi:hypothetical protein
MVFKVKKLAPKKELHLHLILENLVSSEWYFLSFHIAASGHE